MGGRRVAGVVVVVLVTCVWAVAPPVGAASSAGTITGRVTDSLGHPVGPASHICALLGSSSSGWSNLNDDGTYTIDNVPPGKWSVRFDYCGGNGSDYAYAPEYYPNVHEAESVAGQALPNIAVAAGQTVTGIDAQLEPGGTLKVKAVDASNAPLPGLCVIGNRPITYAGTPAVGNLFSSSSGTTGPDGTVTLPGLAAGSYWVEVRACSFADPPFPGLVRYVYSGGVFTEGAAQRLRIEPGTTVSPTITLSAGAQLTGTITRDGQPLSGTCVTWDARDSLEQITTTTATDGTYTIPGITPTLPGKIKACGDTQSVDTWSPTAASRWTAEIITPASGQHFSRDISVQHGATVSAIIQQLPSPTGCDVVVTDSTGATRHITPRPTALAGVYTADAFGLAATGRGATLNCNGKKAGIGRVPETGSPLYQEWDNQNAPVVSIIYDVAGPVITATPANGNRWMKTPIKVTFTCTDAGVGWATCPTPITLGEGQRATVTATDYNGNRTSRVVGPLMVDNTPPHSTIVGDGRTFRTSEPVLLACTMADDRSGIAWIRSNCPAWGTPATAIGVGDHTYTVFAADNAGNVAAMNTTIHIVK
jgi:hypothetical protein